MTSETSDSRWRTAQTAEADYQHFDRPGDSELDRLVDFLGLDDGCFENKTVLGVGAGNGPVYSVDVANHRVGIDPLSGRSESLVEVNARENNSVTTGVGEHLPFQTATFDVVICDNVLDHVKSVPRCLAEIHRVLEPGGLFLLKVNSFRCPSFVRNRLTYLDKPHPHHFHPEEVVNFVERAGFDIVDQRFERETPFSGHNLKVRLATGFFRLTEVGVMAEK